MPKGTFGVTTPIYYINAAPHLGTAYTTVAADTIARYERMNGYDVSFVTGTDEHGQKIAETAEKNGMTPQAWCDSLAPAFTDAWKTLDIDYTNFVRTTEDRQTRAVQKFWQGLYDAGWLYKSAYEGWYCVHEETYYAESDLEKNEDGEFVCPDCKRPVRYESSGEENWFFKLSEFQDKLLAFYDEHPDFIRPVSRRNEIVSFVKGGLQDLSISRSSFDWGIPVPVPGWIDNPNKRLYVWFDAVIGYLSASIEWARRSGDPEAWRAWWNDPATPGYYFMGKDNITFHSQIWPSEMLAYNGEGSKGGEPGELGRLDLPEQVVASEFMTMEGKKFSSSRGIVIYVKDILSRYPVDAVRYYISAAGPESSDSDFTWAEFVRQNNEVLAASWGNLVNRVANLIAKNFGQIPPIVEEKMTDEDRALLAQSSAAFDTVGALIEQHRQKSALNDAMSLVGDINKYISATEPWKIKDDPERLGTVLHVAAQAVSDANHLLAPFLPHSSQKVWEALGGEGTFSPLPHIEEVNDLDDPEFTYPVITGKYVLGENVHPWKSEPIVVGAPVVKPTPIFAKIPPEAVDEELARFDADLKARREAEQARLDAEKAKLAAGEE